MARKNMSFILNASIETRPDETSPYSLLSTALSTVYFNSSNYNTSFTMSSYSTFFKAIDDEGENIDIPLVSDTAYALNFNRESGNTRTRVGKIQFHTDTRTSCDPYYVGGYYTNTSQGVSTTATVYHTRSSTSATGYETAHSITDTHYNTRESIYSTRYLTRESTSTTGYETAASTTATNYNTCSSTYETGYLTKESTSTTGYETAVETTETGYLTRYSTSNTRYLTDIETTETGYETGQQTTTTGYLTAASTTATNYNTRSSTSATGYLTRESTSLTGYETGQETTTTGYLTRYSTSNTRYITDQETTATGYLTGQKTTTTGYETAASTTATNYNTCSSTYDTGYLTRSSTSTTGYETDQETTATGYLTRSSTSTTGYLTAPETTTTGYLTAASTTATGYYTRSSTYETGYLTRESTSETGYLTRMSTSDTGYETGQETTTTGYLTKSSTSTTGYLTAPKTTTTGYLTAASTTATNYNTRSSTSDTGYLTGQKTTTTGYLTRMSTSNTGYLTGPKTTTTGYLTRSSTSTTGYLTAPKTTTTGYLTAESTTYTGYNTRSSTSATGYETGQQTTATGYETRKSTSGTGYETGSQTTGTGYLTRSSTSATGYETGQQTTTTGYLTRQSTSYTGYNTRSSTFQTRYGIETYEYKYPDMTNTETETTGTAYDTIQSYSISSTKTTTMLRMDATTISTMTFMQNMVELCAGLQTDILGSGASSTYNYFQGSYHGLYKSGGFYNSWLHTGLGMINTIYCHNTGTHGLFTNTKAEDALIFSEPMSKIMNDWMYANTMGRRLRALSDDPRANNWWFRAISTYITSKIGTYSAGYRDSLDPRFADATLYSGIDYAFSRFETGNIGNVTEYNFGAQANYFINWVYTEGYPVTLSTEALTQNLIKTTMTKIKYSINSTYAGNIQINANTWSAGKSYHQLTYLSGTNYLDFVKNEMKIVYWDQVSKEQWNTAYFANNQEHILFNGVAANKYGGFTTQSETESGYIELKDLVSHYNGYFPNPQAILFDIAPDRLGKFTTLPASRFYVSDDGRVYAKLIPYMQGMVLNRAFAGYSSTYTNWYLRRTAIRDQITKEFTYQFGNSYNSNKIGYHLGSLHVTEDDTETSGELRFYRIDVPVENSGFYNVLVTNPASITTNDNYAFSGTIPMNGGILGGDVYSAQWCSSSYYLNGSMEDYTYAGTSFVDQHNIRIYGAPAGDINKFADPLIAVTGFDQSGIYEHNGYPLFNDGLFYSLPHKTASYIYSRYSNSAGTSWVSMSAANPTTYTLKRRFRTTPFSITVKNGYAVSEIKDSSTTIYAANSSYVQSYMDYLYYIYPRVKLTKLIHIPDNRVTTRSAVDLYVTYTSANSFSVLSHDNSGVPMLISVNSPDHNMTVRDNIWGGSPSGIVHAHVEIPADELTKYGLRADNRKFVGDFVAVTSPKYIGIMNRVITFSHTAPISITTISLVGPRYDIFNENTIDGIYIGNGGDKTSSTTFTSSLLTLYSQTCRRSTGGGIRAAYEWYFNSNSENPIHIVYNTSENIFYERNDSAFNDLASKTRSSYLDFYRSLLKGNICNFLIGNTTFNNANVFYSLIRSMDFAGGSNKYIYKINYLHGPQEIAEYDVNYYNSEYDSHYVGQVVRCDQSFIGSQGYNSQYYQYDQTRIHTLFYGNSYSQDYCTTSSNSNTDYANAMSNFDMKYGVDRYHLLPHFIGYDIDGGVGFKTFAGINKTAHPFYKETTVFNNLIRDIFYNCHESISAIYTDRYSYLYLRRLMHTNIIDAANSYDQMSIFAKKNSLLSSNYIERSIAPYYQGMFYGQFIPPMMRTDLDWVFYNSKGNSTSALAITASAGYSSYVFSFTDYEFDSYHSATTRTAILGQSLPYFSSRETKYPDYWKESLYFRLAQRLNMIDYGSSQMSYGAAGVGMNPARIQNSNLRFVDFCTWTRNTTSRTLYFITQKHGVAYETTHYMPYVMNTTTVIPTPKTVTEGYKFRTWASTTNTRYLTNTVTHTYPGPVQIRTRTTSTYYDTCSSTYNTYYETRSSTSSTTYGTKQITTNTTYATRQSTSSTTYATKQITTNTTYATRQSTSSTTYGTKQITTNTTYATRQSTYGTYYNTKAYTSATTYGTEQITTETTYGTRQSTSSTTYGTEQITTATTYATRSSTSATTYGTERITTSTTYATRQSTYGTYYDTIEYTSNTTYGTEQITTNTTYGTRQSTYSTTYGTQQITTNTTYATRQSTSSTTYGTRASTSGTTYATRQSTSGTYYDTEEYTSATTYGTQQITTSTTYGTCVSTSATTYGTQEITTATTYGTRASTYETTYATRQSTSGTYYDTIEYTSNTTYGTEQYTSKTTYDTIQVTTATEYDVRSSTYSTTYDTQQITTSTTYATRESTYSTTYATVESTYGTYYDTIEYTSSTTYGTEQITTNTTYGTHQITTSTEYDVRLSTYETTYGTQQYTSSTTYGTRESTYSTTYATRMSTSNTYYDTIEYITGTTYGTCASTSATTYDTRMSTSGTYYDTVEVTTATTYDTVQSTSSTEYLTEYYTSTNTYVYTTI